MTSNAVLKGIKAAWIDMLKPDSFGPLQSFVSRQASRNADEDYFIAANHPGIKQLIDGINFSEMQDFKLTVENLQYYNAIREDRNRIEDSKEYMNNSIEMKLKQISDELVDYDAKLVYDALYAGSTEASSELSKAIRYAFDGVAFFSTYRAIPGSTYTTNKYTETAHALTAATFEADYIGAKKQLLAFVDGNGKPYNANPQLIAFVHPALESYAKQTLNKEATLSASTGVLKSNMLAGDAQVVVNWAAAGSTRYAFYLINGRRSDVALIQDRQDAEWYMEDNNLNPWIGWYYKFRKGVALLNPMSIIRVST